MEPVKSLLTAGCRCAVETRWSVEDPDGSTWIVWADACPHHGTPEGIAQAEAEAEAQAEAEPPAPIEEAIAAIAAGEEPS